MLDKKLMEYGRGNAYPFHMPGHKRQLEFGNPYEIDITEIGGFDNLHHATGILQKAQERAARLYGTDRSYYLVNGSTCGILAAICAAAGKGDRVLVARNCHKAVYHGIFLRELSPLYLYPKVTQAGIQGQISKNDVEAALEQNPDIKAVILTSPTYDGIVSDIASIAEIVHSYGIPLIVDEAHGAHFGFSQDFPENAAALGADAVIVSLHKTLPAFTQTALLHLQGDRIPADRVEEYLDIFETSSPSYVLMAGMDRCIRLVEEQGEVLFWELSKHLRNFYHRMERLSQLHVLQKEELASEEAYDFDWSKILIFTSGIGINGHKLQEILRWKYDLELEMACSNYVLALTSIMDTEEGFRRLGDALLEIDADLGKNIFFAAENGKAVSYVHLQDVGTAAGGKKTTGTEMYRPLERVMEIHQAKEAKEEVKPLEEAAGAVSHTYVMAYPPGIPLVVPGERIDRKLAEDIRTCLDIGLEVEGLTGESGIKIVNSL